MKSFSKKRALSPSLFFLAVGALIHCGGNDNDTSFTTQGDTAVMAGIVGAWMGTSESGHTYTLTLCEDTSATGGTSTSMSCQTLHTVRGDGRGTTETVSKPEGCGGCDYDNSAYVNATIEGDDLTSTTIDGQFDLSGGDANGLGFPYEFKLSGTTFSDQSISITGTMPSAGAFNVESFYYTPNPAPAVDASAADASEVDASDIDASEIDSGLAPAPSSSASSSPSPNAGAVTITNGITFHRVGDATCP
jgi:hypothetical protein